MMLARAEQRERTYTPYTPMCVRGTPGQQSAPDVREAATRRARALTMCTLYTRLFVLPLIEQDEGRRGTLHRGEKTEREREVFTAGGRGRIYSFWTGIGLTRDLGRGLLCIPVYI